MGPVSKAIAASCTQIVLPVCVTWQTGAGPVLLGLPQWACCGCLQYPVPLIPGMGKSSLPCLRRQMLPCAGEYSWHVTCPHCAGSVPTSQVRCARGLPAASFGHLLPAGLVSAASNVATAVALSSSAVTLCVPAVPVQTSQINAAVQMKQVLLIHGMPPPINDLAHPAGSGQSPEVLELQPPALPTQCLVTSLAGLMHAPQLPHLHLMTQVYMLLFLITSSPLPAGPCTAASDAVAKPLTGSQPLRFCQTLAHTVPISTAVACRARAAASEAAAKAQEYAEKAAEATRQQAGQAADLGGEFAQHAVRAARGQPAGAGIWQSLKDKVRGTPAQGQAQDAGAAAGQFAHDTAATAGRYASDAAGYASTKGKQGASAAGDYLSEFGAHASNTARGQDSVWTKLRAALFGESTAERHGKAAGQYASDASATAGQYASDAAATAKQYARQTADKATQTGSDLAGSAEQQAAEFAQHAQQQAQGGSTGVWASLKTMFGGQPSTAASAGDTAGQYLYKGKAAASDAAGQAADKGSDLAASARAAAGDQAPEQPSTTKPATTLQASLMHLSLMCPACTKASCALNCAVVLRLPKPCLPACHPRPLSSP